jgi:hypothetical protein
MARRIRDVLAGLQALCEAGFIRETLRAKALQDGETEVAQAVQQDGKQDAPPQFERPPNAWRDSTLEERLAQAKAWASTRAKK